jgi:phosphohistidine phosphatase SixA
MMTGLPEDSAAGTARDRGTRRCREIAHRGHWSQRARKPRRLIGFRSRFDLFSVSSVTSVLGKALVATCLALVAAAAVADDAALWDRLALGGQVIMIRHSPTVPGVYDPPGFTLDDCASQRGLSVAGREHAMRLGAAFRERNVPVGRVLSSRFCRCIDTAALAFGALEPWEMLDNTGYDDAAVREEKREAVREAASRWRAPGNLVLVSHGFNIIAATGISPAQGEMVILEPLGDDGFRVAGRLTVR